MPTFLTQPLDFEKQDEPTMRDAAASYRRAMQTRRSVRDFSTSPIPLDVVREAIYAAAQAPSGANKQPWTFALVTCPEIKSRIRAAAEKEERSFYETRATADWLADLAPLGTDEEKAFLEDAPALIVVFAQSLDLDGKKHYYVKESVGIACGMLLSALQLAGLATLTHTPSPMQFLGELLGRPKSERAFLLSPVGYPAPDCRVPRIVRKALEEVLVEF
jgi:iodotyrosine deiodinase